MKTVLKSCASFLAGAVMLPCCLCYWLAASVLPADKALAGWSQLVSLFPGLTGAYLRRAFYARVLAKCGPGAHVSFGVLISHPQTSIGDHVYIGPFCCLGEVQLGDDVLVGSHVSVANGSQQHGTARLDIPIREQPGVWPRITIGKDSWIGDRAVIMADVGNHCVIGAGAVVTRPIPDYAIAVGVPARVVRSRRDDVASGVPLNPHADAAANDPSTPAPTDARRG